MEIVATTMLAVRQGSDKEACIAYAELFDLSTIEFSLLEINEDDNN